MILAGRRLNDNMALYVAGQITKLMAQQAHPRERCARAGAGPHLQGELPGHAQLQGGRRGARAARSTARRSTSTIPGPTRRSASTSTASRPVRTLEAPARTTSPWWPWRTGSSASSARAACGACARRRTWCTTSSTCSAAAAGRRPAMKILVTGAAGFIGLHTAQRLLARGDEVRRARQPQRLLRRHPEAGAPGAPRSAAAASASCKLDLADDAAHARAVRAREVPRASCTSPRRPACATRSRIRTPTSTATSPAR